MKVLLSLSILYITPAFCQAACFQRKFGQEMKNDVLKYRDCIDSYDGSHHPPDSMWNTGVCMECNCIFGHMYCCTRYPPTVGVRPGYHAVLNPETCEFEFYKVDNPSEPDY